MPFRYETWKITCEWQNQSFVSKNCLLSIVSNVRNNSNEIWKTVSQANSYLKIAIRHLHISHNAPYSPAKNLFFISPGYYSRSKRNWKQCLCKVLEANKVHYGRCASGVLQSVWIFFKFFHPCLLLYLFSGAMYTVFSCLVAVPTEFW